MEFVNWYLAPWRKIGRAPFNTILGLAAVPGLVLWGLGFGESMSGLAGIFSGAADAGQQLQNLHPDTPQMTNMVNSLLTGTPPGPGGGGGFDWSGVGAWVDGLIWLALVPLVRMRVRDLGYRRGWSHWGWLGAVYAGTVLDLLSKFGVPGLEGLATAGAVVSFVLLAVLCVKHGVPAEETRRMTTAPVDDTSRPRDEPY
jgi:hypothetical protein